MSTLHDRIRAVVEDRLRIARAAEPDGWEPPTIQAAYPEGAIEAHPEDIAFMQANDPADAILGAEHALAVLERHAPGTDYLGRLVCEWCEQGCHSRSGLACNSPDYPYPCDEIRDLATRWRVEVDG